MHGAGPPTLRPLGGVLTAMAVALSGTAVSAVALPWFVLATTGSAARTGLVAFCEMTPYVVVKLFSGPLVDRSGPRTVSWTTDLVSALAAAAVPLLHALDLLSFPLDQIRQCAGLHFSPFFSPQCTIEFSSTFPERLITWIKDC